MEVSEVSQQIKALEETLGETLLERNQRGVRPTWAGQKRLNAAKELIRVVEEVFRKKTAKKNKFASCSSGIYWKIVFGLDWTIRKGVGRDRLH